MGGGGQPALVGRWPVVVNPRSEQRLELGAVAMVVAAIAAVLLVLVRPRP